MSLIETSKARQVASKLFMRNKINRAQAFLLLRLRRGPALAADLFDEGQLMGFSQKTLARASRRVGVYKHRLGYQGQWEWSLTAPVETVGMDELREGLVGLFEEAKDADQD